MRCLRSALCSSPYLNKVLGLLAVALPRMLARVEAELTTARPEQTWRLEAEARLIHK